MTGLRFGLAVSLYIGGVDGDHIAHVGQVRAQMVNDAEYALLDEFRAGQPAW